MAKYLFKAEGGHDDPRELVHDLALEHEDLDGFDTSQLQDSWKLTGVVEADTQTEALDKVDELLTLADYRNMVGIEATEIL